MAGRRSSRDRESEPLEVGQHLFHATTEREGEILDVAKQFTHPKAAPVYSYLVRWDDGLIEAIAEGALNVTREVRLLDEGARERP